MKAGSFCCPAAGFIILLTSTGPTNRGASFRHSTRSGPLLKARPVVPGSDVVQRPGIRLPAAENKEMGVGGLHVSATSLSGIAWPETSVNVGQKQDGSLGLLALGLRWDLGVCLKRGCWMLDVGSLLSLGFYFIHMLFTITSLVWLLLAPFLCLCIYPAFSNTAHKISFPYCTTVYLDIHIYISVSIKHHNSNIV